MKTRFSVLVAAYLILEKDSKILLLRRHNTGWEDGKYSMVSGHLEGNETVADAMIREAKEEAGISIDKDDLKVVHTMQRKSNDLKGTEYIDFFLSAKNWTGEPKNMEPEKCDDLSWFPIDSLPEKVLPHVRQAIGNYTIDITFSEFGWV